MDSDAWDRHQRYLGREIVGDIYVDDYEEDYGDDDYEEDYGDDDFELDPEYDGFEDDIDEVPRPPETTRRDAVREEDWIDHDIDVDRMMSDLFRPGTNHVTDGFRGGGKTHHAVAYAQAMVEGAYPSMGRVILLTNIIFIKRVSFDGDEEEQYEMETPPNVYHVTSMEQMFRLQTKLLKKYGREGVMFLLILDEAQNFLLADEYQQETSIAFIKFYGTTRKFNTCIWLLTPSINNLPPRARNFLDSDPAGYVNARWRKNRGLALRYMRDNGIVDADPREFTQLKLGSDVPPVWFRITTTPWTTAKEDLGIGEYGYDHLANADFGVSINKDNPFDFDKFMERCSDVPSFKMATIMQQFFDEMDGGVAMRDPVEEERIERVRQIDRMRRLSLKWKEIAYILKIPESTCKTWYQKFLMETGGVDPSGGDVGASMPVKKGRHGRRTDGDVSGNAKSVFETPGNGVGKGAKTPVFTDDSSDGNSTFQDIARSKVDDDITLPSDAPYIYNPRDPDNGGPDSIFSTFGPRTVGGRLTPGEGAPGPDGDLRESGSDSDPEPPHEGGGDEPYMDGDGTEDGE